MKTVAVLGASPKEERYSNKAVAGLLDAGYNVIPINPSEVEIHGIKSVPSLSAIKEAPDTLTVYVNPERLADICDEIIQLKPGRAIFNPGTENPEVIEKCRNSGIEVIEACTLVMLKTGTF